MPLLPFQKHKEITQPTQYWLKLYLPSSESYWMSVWVSNLRSSLLLMTDLQKPNWTTRDQNIPDLDLCFGWAWMFVCVQDADVVIKN